MTEKNQNSRDKTPVRTAARKWTELVESKKTLKELRTEQGLVQRSLATKMGLSISRVSEIEKFGFAQQIESIEAHVAALGGRLHIVAEFDDSPPIEIVEPRSRSLAEQIRQREAEEKERS